MSILEKIIKKKTIITFVFSTDFYLKLITNNQVIMEEILGILEEIVEQNKGRINITEEQLETIEKYKSKSINLEFLFESFDIYSDKSEIIKKHIETSDILNISSFIRVNHTHAYGDDGHSKERKGTYRINISGFLNDEYSRQDLIIEVIRIVFKYGLFGKKEEEMKITIWSQTEEEKVIYDGKIANFTLNQSQ